MASKPGILTEWPWTPLGRFKYMVLVPWVVDSIYSTFLKTPNDDRGVDMTYILIFPILVWRAIHNQIWISLSRFRTSKSKNRIVDKPMEFEQVDRETNWDDQIILQGLLFYLGYNFIPLPGATYFPIWNTDGIILTILLHTGPVEFLYYWLHRALHHHFLYSRYHSHHHSSIVTEPITSVIHPFGEHLMYFILFAIPILSTVATETVSIVAVAGYLTYIDLMNNMGHCNFELFRTNYALFMPMYDYLYGTMDKSSDDLYKNSLKRQEESPHVVHLTHPTTPDSIYHLRIGFASLASIPYNNATPNKKWYILMTKWMLWPLNWMFSYINKTFIFERNIFDEDGKGKGTLKMQTWAVPRYSYQYTSQKQRQGINKLIEEAILDADKAGVKVLSLGLLNQGEELNRNGEIYIQKHPKLKTRIVDGSNLAVAFVVNNMVPKGTSQVIMRGTLTKVAYGIAFVLCQRGVRVITSRRDEFEKLKLWLGNNNVVTDNLTLSTSCTTTCTDNDHHQQVWLVGDGFSQEDEKSAPTGTLFIPFSQFPPWMNKKELVRKDCVYYNTPSLTIPPALENVHSCENWLPRRVMSAWRVAGIIHALEKWENHECGNSMSLMLEEDIEKVWDATLRHGFRPLNVPVTDA
ncbi:hypothetical protein MKW98_015141 [Papaver atlanticum]|uniref:Uncharacterized protein n=1 Tax=Papaver atlanticum TaxID=357466 RepID=A0AAD4S754_9MAGN|nr:hypothetical protein MKW98_015141 [Papaver atlanticum]